MKISKKRKTRKSNNQLNTYLKVIKDYFEARNHTLLHSSHQKSAFRLGYFKVLNKLVSIHELKP